MTTLEVPTRFRGPRTSGNGGWSAGAFAALVVPAGDAGWPATTVQLRRPPPLDTALEVGEADGWRTASYAGEVVLRARPAEVDPEPVPAVDVATARAAEAGYPGLTHHPFPTCYACGTGRDDGLRVFAGPLLSADSPDSPVRVAATWTPQRSSLADTWAALDCPGAWALDLGERLLVLGQITARVHHLPEPGEVHVVVAQAGAVDGRRHHARTSLWTATGDLVATTEQVWFAIDAEQFS